MNKVFRTKKTLTFREADPAGIMFFGNVFAIAHDAFEEFIVAAGYTYQEWFGQTDYLIPIRFFAERQNPCYCNYGSRRG